MKFLLWAIRLILFFFLLVFAAQNTEPVTLHFVLGQHWQLPLVLLLLGFFSAGILLGLLALLGHVVALRREVAQLKEARAAQAHAVVDPPVLRP